jgi:hypothetical protein
MGMPPVVTNRATSTTAITRNAMFSQVVKSQEIAAVAIREGREARRGQECC